MIPKIIHQTWKNERIPDPYFEFAESWGRHNPGWRRILWTDRMLLEFVAERYPDLLEIYCSYANSVCRADAARYMLLHSFGGLYADVDVECLDSFDTIESEERVVLCHEPPTHWNPGATYRSHPFVLFNGVMAGPAGHPFWEEVIRRLPQTRHGTDVLDMTGPFLLTGVYLGFGDKETIAVHSCQLFTPTDHTHAECPPYGEPVPATLTRHHWAKTWIWRGKDKLLKRGVEKVYNYLKYRLTRGAVLDPKEARNRIDANVLNRPPPAGNTIAILVPVRDAAPHLDAFVDAISRTDLPRAKTKLVFCEGDSVDDTWERLQALAPKLRTSFRDVVLLRKDVGTRFQHSHRWDRRIQRPRRAGIAAVRNHLIDHGLDESDDWALWIDIDVWRFPEDLFKRLRSAGARIVVPNCVKVAGGASYDMNSFVSDWSNPHRSSAYYRYMYGGVFQPPYRGGARLYLDGFRHSDRVELDGVGGTTLLVDASLHRAGLHFPEIPYKDLIETEAFGVLARDVGVRAVGLPNVEVIHVPY